MKQSMRKRRLIQIISAAVVFLVQGLLSEAFSPTHHHHHHHHHQTTRSSPPRPTRTTPTWLHRGPCFSRWRTIRRKFGDDGHSRFAIVSPTSDTLSSEDQVATIRAEADRIRKEAESLERTLMQEKISSIEQKLGSQKWVAKNPLQKSKLENELSMLKQKLSGTDTPVAVRVASATSSLSSKAKQQLRRVSKTAEVLGEPKPKRANNSVTSSSESSLSPTTVGDPLVPDTPFRGFDEEDLKAYIPVAQQVEASMPSNATMAQKIENFRKAPELRDYFQQKVRKMILKPIEDAKRLEKLKIDYLQTMSKVEKRNIKREMNRLEKSLKKERPLLNSDTVFLKIAPISEQELEERIQAVSALPSLLQAMFKQRLKLDEDADLRLAILLDRYNLQLQMLEQIRFDADLNQQQHDSEGSDNTKEEAINALKSLPVPVRDHLAAKYELSDGSDLELLFRKLMEPKNSVEFSSIQNLVVRIGGASDEVYNDIDYIYRSGYAAEYFPGLARLEEIHPSDKDMERFLSEVVDMKKFMVRGRPERVVGGYYVRGYNMITDDDDSGVKLVKLLSERLEASSSLRGKVEFFFIDDPDPQAEEDLEMENEQDKVLYVTAVDRERLCNNANGFTKAFINALGLASMGLFSVLSASGNSPTETFTAESLLSSAVPVGGFLFAVQVAHELGHRLGAMPHNITLGLPSVIPSLTMGYLSTVTPLTSPPPDLKALFDFAMAGPLSGFLASGFLLTFGLLETLALDATTTTTTAAQILPQLPISLLRSSALGGGLIEAVLGCGTLLRDVELSSDVMLSLHPAAIGGFIGLITNALALLPLGNTDGGRIALAMLGRPGSYISSRVMALLLCILGLLGMDQTNTLLVYTLFAVLWQRELEIPACNEVEQLDFVRGVVGIASFCLAALTLLPMS